MIDILPTGTCFDDALEYIERRVLRVPALASSRKLLLVHALCLADDGVTRYAHAWAEEAGVCWDCGIVNGEKSWFALDPASMDRMRHVLQKTKYTCIQVLRHNRQSGHYGPWEEPYAAHVGDGGELKILGSALLFPEEK